MNYIYKETSNKACILTRHKKHTICARIDTQHVQFDNLLINYISCFCGGITKQHSIACTLSARRCNGNRNELSSRDIDAGDVTLPLPESFITPNED